MNFVRSKLQSIILSVAYLTTVINLKFVALIYDVIYDRI